MAAVADTGAIHDRTGEVPVIGDIGYGDAVHRIDRPDGNRNSRWSRHGIGGKIVNHRTSAATGIKEHDFAARGVDATKEPEVRASGSHAGQLHNARARAEGGAGYITDNRLYW